MNQTKKRLSIIKLAISIGDIETIQLQILKLSPLKADEKIREIIQGLQSENYAQTQALIQEYIETPTEEILQRTSQHTVQTPEEAEAIIEEFDLFRISPKEQNEEKEEILDLDTFDTDEKKVQEDKETNYDTLLNLQSKDIMVDNIDIQQTSLPKDNFFEDHNGNEPLSFNNTESIEEDDFFHQETDQSTEVDNTPVSDTYETDTIQTLSPENSNHSLSTQKDDTSPLSYKPIPYIDQKFKNMLIQYPPAEKTNENFHSVDTWLTKISCEGYTEEEIEEIIIFIQQLEEEKKSAEAAQLLLITAATESKYAQFMLARSLFKGDLLEKNLPEAFTLINRLAMDDDYAEAICDLGQLYEYGIGIDKDMVRAEELYKEAMELGIQRAAAHYKRVHQANKSLFAKLFRR